MKHSWDQKLDPRGLQLIEILAKLGRVRQPTGLNAGELRRWLEDEKSVLSSYPELDELSEKRKVNLDPRFIELFVKTDPDCELSEKEMQEMFEEEEWPLLRAEQLEIHQRIALMFEADQALRFQAYSAIALAIVFLRKIFSSSLKKQFGTKKVSWFKMASAIAQHLRWFGDIFRGQVG
jgi:hypothetical protein